MSLTIGRPKTLAIVRKIIAEHKKNMPLVGVVCYVPQGDSAAVLMDDFHEIGCVARILGIEKQQEQRYVVRIQGLSRFRAREFTDTGSHFEAQVDHIAEQPVSHEDINERALVVALRKTTIESLTARATRFPPGLFSRLKSLVANTEAHKLPDVAGYLLLTALEDKLTLLDTIPIGERLEVALKLLQKQTEVTNVAKQIASDVTSKMNKLQREYYLKQQLKAIQKELGGDEDAEEGGIEGLASRVESAGLSEAAATVARREVKRLKSMEANHPEYPMLRAHVECLVDLPWNKRAIQEDTSASEFIAQCKRILEEDHFGLEKAKRRVHEYLAVRRLLKDDVKPPVLLLVGPPGVGKTSIGRSIARALNRPYHRVALGGVYDESEIRGHRQTYIASLPGMIVQGLRKVGVCNPVFVLDEVDKLGKSYKGDVSAALLEVLDPEQNDSFSDHYLGVPFNLSEVVFVATANSTETIPAPLLDRMEVIHVSGYTMFEKMQIAKRHLLPKQLRNNGLADFNVTFEDEILTYLTTSYTREAGVRGLERDIAAVCRGVALELMERGSAATPVDYTVTKEKIEDVLGPPRVHDDLPNTGRMPGVAVGLAWTPSGGAVLPVETIMMPGSGKITLTGSLGDVMKESCQAALSWIRANASSLGIEIGNRYSETDIHVHFPAGAVSKDGPSAGVTVVTALVSLFSKTPVRERLAMTGEITLRGAVMPVGGVKAKVIAAHHHGIKVVVLPAKNRKDLADVPQEVRADLEFVFACTLADVLVAAFPALAMVEHARPQGPSDVLSPRHSLDSFSATSLLARL